MHLPQTLTDTIQMRHIAPAVQGPSPTIHCAQLMSYYSCPASMQCMAMHTLRLANSTCHVVLQVRHMCSQVLGNAKGVAAVVVSMALFQNPFSAPAALGYAITLAGVCAYALAKRKERSISSSSCCPLGAASQAGQRRGREEVPSSLAENGQQVS